MNRISKQKNDSSSDGAPSTSVATTTTTTTPTSYNNVSFRGKAGGRISLNKKGLLYREHALQDGSNTSISVANENSKTIKIFWKSLKEHKIHKTNLLLKLTNFEDKALIFKLANLEELERIYADIAARREQCTLLDDSEQSLNSSSSTDGMNASETRRMNGSREARSRLPPGKPKSSLLEERKEQEKAGGAKKKEANLRKIKCPSNSPRKTASTNQAKSSTARSSKPQLHVDDSEADDDDDDATILSRYAVSVHYLQSVFLQEVQAAGMDPTTTPIHDIENLSGKPGLIRNKGAGVHCPMDGRLGAAYVHCLAPQQSDHVGVANYMLSYSWRYVTLEYWHGYKICGLPLLLILYSRCHYYYNILF